MKKIMVGLILLVTLVSSCKNLHYTNYERPFDFLKLNNDRFVVKNKTQIKSDDSAKTTTIEEASIQHDTLDFNTESFAQSKDTLTYISISDVEATEKYNNIQTTSESKKIKKNRGIYSKSNAEVSTVKIINYPNKLRSKLNTKRKNIHTTTSKQKGRLYDLLFEDGLLFVVLGALLILFLIWCYKTYSYVAILKVIIISLYVGFQLLILGCAIFALCWLLMFPIRMLPGY